MTVNADMPAVDSVEQARVPTLLMLAGIVLSACLVAMSGTGAALPLDDHEAFVARSAEEMLERGSLVVPYLNGEPRVNKPPLAYWLTMLVDALGDDDARISEWEARIPSMTAGSLFALSTFALGSVLFDTVIAFVSSMLLISSAGFVTYSHSARPEMLYAMLCCAGLACFSKSWKKVTRGHPDKLHGIPDPRPNIWPWLGWFLMGVAVLAKGPQLPVILVAGWAVAMGLSGDRRRTLMTLRPFSGILIASAVSLWWFILVWWRVTGSGQRMNSEILGRIFNFHDEPLWRYLDPYYLYRAASLVAPWVVLYVIALAAPCIREIRMGRSARLLWWLVVLSGAVMHATLSRRWYYLLPLTGAMSVLMAWSTIAVGRAMVQAGLDRLFRLLVAGHIVACAAALLWYWQQRPGELRPANMAVVAMTISAVGMLFVLFAVRQQRLGVVRPLLLAGIAALMLLTLAAAHGSLWSEDRFARRAFSLDIADDIPDGVPLFGWHNNWQIEQYYLHRVIPTCQFPSHLNKALRTSGEAWLLVDSDRAVTLPRHVHSEVARRALIKPGRELQLWRLTASGSSDMATALFRPFVSETSKQAMTTTTPATAKVLYTGRTHTTGGRDGATRSSDGLVDSRTRPPRISSPPPGRPATSLRLSTPPPGARSTSRFTLRPVGAFHPIDSRLQELSYYSVDETLGLATSHGTGRRLVRLPGMASIVATYCRMVS